MAAKLVEILQADNSLSGQQILNDIAREIKHPDPQVVVNGGVEILKSMRDKDIILGVRQT